MHRNRWSSNLRMGKRIVIVLAIIVAVFVSVTSQTQLTASATLPFKDRVNLHGGSFSTKSMAMWELYRFRDTTLLRKEPLCWCPFKAYLLVNAYVKVEDKDNKNWLTVTEDIYSMCIDDAEYNKSHAPVYKGTAKEKVRKIYNYVRRSDYVLHVKYARNVFEDREGDCAGWASAFYVMCKKNKIPVRYCIGWAEGSCHAWNRVKIGKNWYYIDTAMGRYLWKPLYEGYSIMECW